MKIIILKMLKGTISNIQIIKIILGKGLVWIMLLPVKIFYFRNPATAIQAMWLQSQMLYMNMIVKEGWLKKCLQPAAV
jgi:hypothetical protein